LQVSVPPESSGGALTRMELVERQAIVEALQSTGGRRVEAANRLGIGKTTLYKKLKEYGL
jgi:sigma-54 dependent transcriptional regulator, acetoin dehydrogenase operon transcriptional activator AcoR